MAGTYKFFIGENKHYPGVSRNSLMEDLDREKLLGRIQNSFSRIFMGMFKNC